MKTSEHLANSQTGSVHKLSYNDGGRYIPTPLGKKVLVYSTMKA